MASQTDAMETAKEVLRQMIKYRFWISIGIAALFATIAYVVGSGPVQAEAKKEIDGILAAEKEVKTYSSLSIPTKEYKPIVEAKTKVVTADVLSAWRTLYDRQAPLLTWPEGVQERFQTWGPKWPEKVSPKTIELAIVDYIDAYPGYVDMVYKTFDPFDYETGEGVVAAPAEGDLLLPAQFNEDHLPDLGKIWAAQERLWIQLTVLKVIADVNKDAKKWDQAVIRQILQLDVGDPGAQDQRSLAKNETLEESKGIYAPGEEPVAAEGGGGNMAAPGGGKGGANMMTSGGSGRSRGGDSMGGFGAGGSQTAGPETIFYVKSDSDKYKVLPFAVTVLIDQDRVQDFLVELENSPMSIQVKDFELSRPLMKVAKPEKGDAAASFGLFGTGGGGGRMGGAGMGGMVGMGGMFSQMQQMQASQAQNQRMMGDMANMSSFGGGGSGSTAKAKKGADNRGKDRAKARADKEKDIAAAKGPVLMTPTSISCR